MNGYLRTVVSVAAIVVDRAVDAVAQATGREPALVRMDLLREIGRGVNP